MDNLKCSSFEIELVRREAVLKAMDAVCRDRGWKRISGPVFEDEQNRASPCSVIYDTMAQGLLEFRVALDGIQAASSP